MTDSDNQQGYEPDEITPEMIEAGAGVLLDMNSDDFTNFDRAKATYVAMSEARRVCCGVQSVRQSSR